MRAGAHRTGRETWVRFERRGASARAFHRSTVAWPAGSLVTGGNGSLMAVWLGSTVAGPAGRLMAGVDGSLMAVWLGSRAWGKDPARERASLVHRRRQVDQTRERATRPSASGTASWHLGTYRRRWAQTSAALTWGSGAPTPECRPSCPCAAAWRRRQACHRSSTPRASRRRGTGGARRAWTDPRRSCT